MDGVVIASHRGAAVFCAALLFSLTAAAQVIRCEDPKTGKVSYTDGTCPGLPSRVVAPAPSPQDLQLERERNQLARERLALERERAASRAEAEEREAAKYGNVTPVRPKSESHECQVAKRNLGVGINWESKKRSQREYELACFGDAAVDVERARAGQPKTTIIIKR